MHIRLVAVGTKARQEADYAIDAIQASGQPEPTPIYLDSLPIDGMTSAQASRYKKTTMATNPTDLYQLYLDADTRVGGDLSPLRQILEDGWDMAIAPSQHQGDECLWHVDEREREATYSELGYLPLQLQCGVMAYRINERVQNFFSTWHGEWLRYQGEDQAAFLRALAQVPLKIWLLGRPWNGGAIIAHQHGRCRE